MFDASERGNRQVDENGDAVPGGIQCNATAFGAAVARCTTAYVYVGQEVHLLAHAPAGFAATWSLCDSVNGDLSTKTITIGPQTVELRVD